MERMPDIESIEAGFKEQHYIIDRELATIVFLMSQLERPLLVEGPAGVGKTELAQALADTLGTQLIRL
ncbi:MAG: hypothetical protein OER04_17015, partial [Cyclobacteriaceae bacterium]|nr:hypothetical protein [Cyclobacteriaceae bacterium]